MNAMQSSTRKRTVAKKRVTGAKRGMLTKWCDVADWWRYIRQGIPMIAVTALAWFTLGLSVGVALACAV